MKEALKDVPAIPFRVAPGIEEVPIDWKSGNPVPAGTPGAIMEAFKSGTAPGEANAPLDDQAQGQPGTPDMTAQQRPNGQPAPTVSEGTGGIY